MPVGLPKADDLSDHVVEATVDQQPRSLGQRFSPWTRESLRTSLAEKLPVTVAASTVGRPVRRLGWTVVRPALTVRSPDPV